MASRSKWGCFQGEYEQKSFRLCDLRHADAGRDEYESFAEGQRERDWEACVADREI
jgi:hypothetical protein